MNCRNITAKLSGYLDDELEVAQKDMIATHLKSCADCRRELESLQRIKCLCRHTVVPVPNQQQWQEFERGLYKKLQQPPDDTPRLSMFFL